MVKIQRRVHNRPLIGKNKYNDKLFFVIYKQKEENKEEEKTKRSLLKLFEMTN